MEEIQKILPDYRTEQIIVRYESGCKKPKRQLKINLYNIHY